MKRETHRNTTETDKETIHNRTGVWLDAKAVREDGKGSPLHHSSASFKVTDRIATDMGHENEESTVCTNSEEQEHTVPPL